MCKTHITLPFNFFCYTDDPKGIDGNVGVIDFVDHDFDIIVYNKLFMFSEHFDKQLPPGQRVFFDLDLIIKMNIDHVVTYQKGDLTLIDAQWREKHPHGYPSFHHPFNSSCMTWSSPNTRSIWNHVSEDPEKFMAKYYWGMDSFMFYEKDNINVDIQYFPHRQFYSFMYGVDFEENHIHDPIHNGYRPSKFVDIVKKIPVVLFNGPTKPEDYLKMFDEFYAS